MADWIQLFSEINELSTPPRLRERVLSGTRSDAGHRPALRGFGVAGKWGLAAVATVVVLLGLALAAHTRDTGTKPRPAHGRNDYQIVPGIRIGVVAIGDTRNKVESAIGKADAYSASGDSITATYRGAGVTVTYADVVRFKGQPVHTKLAVLIRTTSPAYSTAEDIHVGSTLADLRRAYNVNCAPVNRGGGNECAAGNTAYSVYEGGTATRPFKVDVITVTAQIGSDGTLLTPPGAPFHSVTVRGTRAFSAGELTLPLTVHCPQSGATGFKQVIRSPWKLGKVVYYGGSSSGGGMDFAVGESGTVRITC